MTFFDRLMVMEVDDLIIIYIYILHINPKVINYLNIASTFLSFETCYVSPKKQKT